MATAREAQPRRGMGSLWGKQLELWISYGEMVQGGSNKLLNLWAHQAFGWQKHTQKSFGEWAEFAGRTGQRTCEAINPPFPGRGAPGSPEKSRAEGYRPEEHRGWHPAEVSRGAQHPHHAGRPPEAEDVESRARPGPPPCLEVKGSHRLVGEHVYNSQGEKLGKIEELMLDTDQGEIAYAVLSFGGFLGMGGKLFAVPWRALKLDESSNQIMLEVRKEDLEHAPGFDREHWPCAADMEWARKVYTYEKAQTHGA